jgi:hypothetical protein
MCTGFNTEKEQANRLLERLMYKWQDDIKTDLKETGWVWSGIIRFRGLVNTVKNVHFPKQEETFLI